MNLTPLIPLAVGTAWLGFLFWQAKKLKNGTKSR